MVAWCNHLSLDDSGESKMTRRTAVKFNVKAFDESFVHVFDEVGASAQGVSGANARMRDLTMAGLNGLGPIEGFIHVKALVAACMAAHIEKHGGGSKRKGATDEQVALFKLRVHNPVARVNEALATFDDAATKSGKKAVGKRLTVLGTGEIQEKDPKAESSDAKTPKHVKAILAKVPYTAENEKAINDLVRVWKLEGKAA